MGLVFLLHFAFIRTFYTFFAMVRGRVSRVGVISSLPVVLYSEVELVWDGEGAIFACSLIFLAGGTSLSVLPLQSIISPAEFLTSLNSFRIRI